MAQVLSFPITATREFSCVNLSGTELLEFAKYVLDNGLVGAQMPYYDYRGLSTDYVLVVKVVNAGLERVGDSVFGHMTIELECFDMQTQAYVYAILARWSGLGTELGSVWVMNQGLMSDSQSVIEKFEKALNIFPVTNNQYWHSFLVGERQQYFDSSLRVLYKSTLKVSNPPVKTGIVVSADTEWSVLD